MRALRATCRYHERMIVMQEYFCFLKGRRPMPHLQTLHHAGHHLMLQATVFSLRVLTNGDEIDIIVPASALVHQDTAILTC